MTRPPILFLFKSARKQRLNESGPREFFFGFTEMASRGIDASLAEEDEFPLPEMPAGLEKAATFILDPLGALNAAALARFSTPAAVERLNSAAALVATTNAQGLALGALKSLGRLSVPILFLSMGAWPLHASPWRGMFLKRWLSPISLAPIGYPEAVEMRRHLPGHGDLDYLPFGVDTRFWTPNPSAEQGKYVLAIGNDRHRDWACLAAAWQSDMPTLKLVTRRPVPDSLGPVEVIRGDWNERALSDPQICDLYRKARFVVLPLEQTLQPAGQSACLQAMACGKAVIISSIRGLWDREVVSDGETCLLVEPGNSEQLQDAIYRLLNDPELTRDLAARARAIVCDRFSLARMSDALVARLNKIAAKTGRHDEP
ncbi:putative Glycosyl transferase group 1 [Rhodospirillaceae bacterium LM-1]|nr:putative Glycosyl transferase group 1 [Rhodospirillaceae bacterium LM-1]